MNFNTFELAAWGNGHRELVAQDVRNARYDQSLVMQRLVRLLNRLGGRIEEAGKRLANVPERNEQQLSHW